ncbi:HD domain-containing protein [Thermogladius sp. KZ2Tp1]|uniref:HD domain-containing protein n=1 Tax=Thermogladius sp. KZ2Tp1 TaxID=3136289 RepID=UPI003DAA3FEA
MIELESGPSPFPWMLPFNAQVRDVIYNYIDYIKGVEDIVMDSWPLQRLRYILQLQMAHFVYPSATHTRFNHSLGVMHVSYKYITYLLKGSLEYLSQSKHYSELSARLKEISLATRLLGLLHDIGHGPFSHAFDEYVYKTRDFLPYVIGNHEILGYLIYRENIRRLIEQALKDNYKALGVDPEYALNVLDDGLKPPLGMKDYTELLKKGHIKPEDFFVPTRDKALSTIVRLVVRDYIFTSDIMDYLKRDSYYTGLAIGEINEEWLLRNTFIVEHDGLLKPAVSSKAVDDLVRLLEARKMMYKNVYFHHVNIAFVETVGRLLKCIKSRVTGILEDMLDRNEWSKYVLLNDFSIYGVLQSLVYQPASELECEDRDFAKRALESLFVTRKPIWKLLSREVLKLEDARVLFSTRFSRDLKNKIKSEIVSELNSRFGKLQLSDEDVLTLYNKVDVFPSAGSEIVKHLLVVSLKDSKVIGYKEVNFNSFAERHGLVPEALVTVYLERRKYKMLDEDEVAEAKEIVANVISDLVKARIAEAPETS